MSPELHVAHAVRGVVLPRAAERRYCCFNPIVTANPRVSGAAHASEVEDVPVLVRCPHSPAARTLAGHGPRSQTPQECKVPQTVLLALPQRAKQHSDEAASAKKIWDEAAPVSERG
jgi:hypothetical protein